MSNCDCTLVIAGPGAGKTTNMVREIYQCLPELTPNRYMAVITYTNAATEKIKTRLTELIKIPENVFIGTIHSFLYRFILNPYGRLYGILPADYYIVGDIDFSFLDERHFQGKGQRIITEKGIEKICFLKVW